LAFDDLLNMYPLLEGLLDSGKEWTLANIGGVDWPEDATAQLFYNTPGLAHLPTDVPLPAAKVGQTVQVGITALMPDFQGRFKAMWAVTSPSSPDFGDILFVEFCVSEFPFMEWMLAYEAKADLISESTDKEQEQPKVEKLSASFASRKRYVPQCRLPASMSPFMEWMLAYEAKADLISESQTQGVDVSFTDTRWMLQHGLMHLVLDPLGVPTIGQIGAPFSELCIFI
jgi:hypothetical protein